MGILCGKAMAAIRVSENGTVLPSLRSDDDNSPAFDHIFQVISRYGRGFSIVVK